MVLALSPELPRFVRCCALSDAILRTKCLQYYGYTHQFCLVSPRVPQKPCSTRIGLTIAPRTLAPSPVAHPTKHPAPARTGRDHHCRRFPSVSSRQRSEFDDDDDDYNDQQQQRHPHTRNIMISSWTYFSSPTASSAAASAVAFSEACYHASLALAAASPSDFSRKTHYSSNNLKKFFYGGSLGDRSERSVTGRRAALWGEKKSDGGVTGDESSSNRVDQKERRNDLKEGRAAGEPVSSTTGVESSPAAALSVGRKLKRRHAHKKGAPSTFSFPSAAHAGGSGAEHRSPADPPNRGGSSGDAGFLADGPIPPAADKRAKTRDNSTRTYSTCSQLGGSSARRPWRPMFMCRAGGGDVSEGAAGSGGKAVQSGSGEKAVQARTRTVSMGSRWQRFTRKRKQRAHSSRGDASLTPGGIGTDPR